jgi:hypothetical protein
LPWSAVGLEVAGLEASRQMAVVEFDPAEQPERSTNEWERGLDEARTRGLNALWYSRFAVGPEHDAHEGVLAFERAWEACFRGRPVVTLCPYVVGAVDAGRALDRLTTLTPSCYPAPTAGPRSAPPSRWIEGPDGARPA